MGTPQAHQMTETRPRDTRQRVVSDVIVTAGNAGPKHGSLGLNEEDLGPSQQ